jgi:type III pantothenate kinase
MILALDIGNTRLKWSLHQHGQFIRDDAVSLSALDSLDWSSIPRPTHVIGANVAGAAMQEKVEKLTARFNLPVRWVVPGARGGGVRNCYDNPAQLGPDRWAALIGARAQVSGACVVANSGTALTVDALSSNGDFRGGLILPGLELMQQSLAENTARLAQSRGTWQVFPRNSGDAVTSGALMAAVGAIDRMVAALRETENAPPRVVLTGGNAAALRTLIPDSLYCDRLVMEGLVTLAQEETA